MKKLLILTILAAAVSCKAKNENISYVDHISQIDSIVYANKVCCPAMKPMVMLWEKW